MVKRHENEPDWRDLIAAIRSEGLSETRSPGELGEYARERGKTEILREVMNQQNRLECAYGGGNCIVSYWDEGREGSPVRLSKCSRATQIGETKTRHGKTRRLEQAGCPEPNYSIWSGAWKCKYADGDVHRG
jgi:hypothetical protein